MDKSNKSGHTLSVMFVRKYSHLLEFYINIRPFIIYEKNPFIVMFVRECMHLLVIYITSDAVELSTRTRLAP